jgi:putative acetyltransferase
MTSHPAVPLIREEGAGDEDAIRTLTGRAFEGHPHSDGSEPFVIDRLRKQGALTLSLVAVIDGRIVGHIAFSPAANSEQAEGWYALGPISVEPDRQGLGIGSMLVRDGLTRLRAQDAKGCILMGNPAYYQRFGFEVTPRSCPPDLPASHFMTISFKVLPAGTFSFHHAFFGGASP